MTGCVVIQPSRQPDAIVLENVSNRTTRPAVSILRYESFDKWRLDDLRNGCSFGFLAEGNSEKKLQESQRTGIVV